MNWTRIGALAGVVAAVGTLLAIAIGSQSRNGVQGGTGNSQCVVTGNNSDCSVGAEAATAPSEVVSEITSELSGTPAPRDYQYVAVSDERDVIQVEVPTSYSDRFRDSWAPSGVEGYEDAIIGPLVLAQNAYDGPNEPPGNPGIFIAASIPLVLEYDPLELVEGSDVDGCTRSQLGELARGEYSGHYAIYTCEQSGITSTFYYAALWPESRSHLVVFESTEQDERDSRAREVALATFEVDEEALAAFPVDWRPSEPATRPSPTVVSTPSASPSS
jgi:hypothetical protein